VIIWGLFFSPPFSKTYCPEYNTQSSGIFNKPMSDFDCSKNRKEWVSKIFNSKYNELIDENTIKDRAGATIRKFADSTAVVLKIDTVEIIYENTVLAKIQTMDTTYQALLSPSQYGRTYDNPTGIDIKLLMSLKSYSERDLRLQKQASRDQ